MLIEKTGKAVLLVAFLITAGAGRAAEKSLAISIQLYDNARVEQEILLDAKAEVTGIFYKAGLETLWAAPSNKKSQFTISGLRLTSCLVRFERMTVLGAGSH